MHSRRLLLAAIPALALSLLLIQPPRPPLPDLDQGNERGPERPSDWWEAQRAFPGGAVDPAAFAAAREQARFDRLLRLRKSFLPQMLQTARFPELRTAGN